MSISFFFFFCFFNLVKRTSWIRSTKPKQGSLAKSNINMLGKIIRNRTVALNSAKLNIKGVCTSHISRAYQSTTNDVDFKNHIDHRFDDSRLITHTKLQKPTEAGAEESLEGSPSQTIATALSHAYRIDPTRGTRPIYLDVQATTPLDPRVLDKMMNYYTGLYGNPHSNTHSYGWETNTEIENAREQVADLIGANAKEIIFTSGATESNNLAIKGIAKFYGSSSSSSGVKKNHIITTNTEHKCVLEASKSLKDEGFEVTYLKVDNNGLVDLKELEKHISEKTCLVSIMGVNNEIGVVQNLKAIGELCRSKKVYFHSDCAQAYGKIPIDVEDMKIDLMSISSHKIYGPKGIGALYVRRRPRVRLQPIISGGGQERNLRSGTLAPPLVVGFGEAARLMAVESEADIEHVTRLSKKLTDALLKIEETSLNGDPDHRYPGCVNVSFAFVEGESLLMALRDVALSSGSACTSASLEPSYVLSALGKDEALAHSSIRFGIGRFTTEEEIDYVIKAITERVEFLREMSPLWELHKDGVDLNTIEWSGH